MRTRKNISFFIGLSFCLFSLNVRAVASMAQRIKSQYPEKFAEDAVRLLGNCSEINPSTIADRWRSVMSQTDTFNMKERGRIAFKQVFSRPTALDIEKRTREATKLMITIPTPWGPYTPNERQRNSAIGLESSSPDREISTAISDLFVCLKKLSGAQLSPADLFHFHPLITLDQGDLIFVFHSREFPKDAHVAGPNDLLKIIATHAQRPARPSGPPSDSSWERNFVYSVHENLFYAINVQRIDDPEGEFFSGGSSLARSFGTFFENSIPGVATLVGQVNWHPDLYTEDPRPRASE